MKVFISADIEGIATTTRWDQTGTLRNPSFAAPYRQQMTDEVKAACEGAIAAGATKIVVKDAHGPAVNIHMDQLPKCVEVVRNWSGNPYGMVEGIDESFDAVMFVGYHSAAGRCGNPLSHTISTSTLYIKINGVKCSEFQMYSWACALLGVPSVMLAGDKMLCEDSAPLHPLLKTVAVKDGFGGATRSLHPQLACEMIKQTAEQALKQDLSKALCTVPEHFTVEICYKEHKDAVKYSYFPGFKALDDNTIIMETDDLLDALLAFRYIL